MRLSVVPPRKTSPSRVPVLSMVKEAPLFILIAKLPPEMVPLLVTPPLITTQPVLITQLLGRVRLAPTPPALATPPWVIKLGIAIQLVQIIPHWVTVHYTVIRLVIT